MNRSLFRVQHSLQQENYIFTQQLHRLQAKTHLQSNLIAPPSPTYEAPPAVTTHSGEPRPLPDMVAPGNYDVICARGSAAANHVGNLRFREIIRLELPKYKDAKTKLEKSLIVTSIVDAVRDYSPNGGFVKQDDSGQWYDVGDALAREKIGQCIRDQLHSKYKSSTKAKKARRKELEKKKQGVGRTAPPKRAESTPAVVTPRPNDGERRASVKALATMLAQRGDALDLLMLGPIGESFVPLEGLKY